MKKKVNVVVEFGREKHIYRLREKQARVLLGKFLWELVIMNRQEAAQ